MRHGIERTFVVTQDNRSGPQIAFAICNHDIADQLTTGPAASSAILIRVKALTAGYQAAILSALIFSPFSAASMWQCVSITHSVGRMMKWTTERCMGTWYTFIFFTILLQTPPARQIAHDRSYLPWHWTAYHQQPESMRHVRSAGRMPRLVSDMISLEDTHCVTPTVNR